MIKGVKTRRGVGRCLGVAAAAMLMLSALPSERTEAASLINPAAAPLAKRLAGGLTTEVRGHGGGGGGGYRGGGGGGHHGGAVHFGGGGVRAAPAFRAGPAFHGGGARYGAYRSSGNRYGGFRHGGFRFAHRHHFHHRRFFYGSYYDYPSYYYPYRHRCRVIWTYHGPRRVCRWHHHRRHHWRVY